VARGAEGDNLSQPRDGTKVIVREGTRIRVAAFERPNFNPTAPEARVLYLDYGLWPAG